MRASKTVNGVTHYYTYDGLKLIREEWGNNVLVFLYDAYGSPIGMQYRTTSYAEDVWDTYYYEKNLQGDVIAIYNASGTKLVNYAYDPFGRLVSITDGNGNDVRNNGGHLANVNPIKYRGYYYDRDLSLYYLASRYYDPFTCRFITADSYVSTGQGILGHNRYAYCGNNPVMYVDYTGESPIAIIVVLFSIVTTVVSSVLGIIELVEDIEETKDNLEAPNNYKRTYCIAVSEYNKNKELNWDDPQFACLNEAFSKDKDRWINAVKSDVELLEINKEHLDHIDDVDYLYEHFGDWAVNGHKVLTAPSGKGAAESGIKWYIKFFEKLRDSMFKG